MCFHVAGVESDSPTVHKDSPEVQVYQDQYGSTALVVGRQVRLVSRTSGETFVSCLTRGELAGEGYIRVGR